MQEEVKEDTVKHDGGVDASSLLPKRELMIKQSIRAKKKQNEDWG